MEINGNRHALRITEPVPGTPADHQDVIDMLPGFTEDPSTGTARNLHNDVASENPFSKTVSISSDGVSKHDSPLNFRDILRRRFRDMAEDRLEITRELAGDRAVLLSCLSMGTVIGLDMIEANLEAPEAIINHKGTIFHSPAIVERRRIARDMALRFPPHIGLDSFKQTLRHPGSALKTLHVPHFPLCAYSSEIVNLLQGTSLQKLEGVVAETKLGVIAGDKDPLAQIDMWEDMMKIFPENVILRIKHGEGHGMSVNSKIAARDISEVATELGWLAASGATLATSSL